MINTRLHNLASTTAKLNNTLSNKETLSPTEMRRYEALVCDVVRQIPSSLETVESSTRFYAREVHPETDLRGEILGNIADIRARLDQLGQSKSAGVFQKKKVYHQKQIEIIKRLPNASPKDLTYHENGLAKANQQLLLLGEC